MGVVTHANSPSGAFGGAPYRTTKRVRVCRDTTDQGKIDVVTEQGSSTLLVTSGVHPGDRRPPQGPRRGVPKPAWAQAGRREVFRAGSSGVDETRTGNTEGDGTGQVDVDDGDDDDELKDE